MCRFDSAWLASTNTRFILTDFYERPQQNLASESATAVIEQFGLVWSWTLVSFATVTYAYSYEQSDLLNVSLYGIHMCVYKWTELAQALASDAQVKLYWMCALAVVWNVVYYCLKRNTHMHTFGCNHSKAKQSKSNRYACYTDRRCFFHAVHNENDSKPVNECCYIAARIAWLSQNFPTT